MMVSNPFDTEAIGDTEPSEIVSGQYVAWARDLDITDTDYLIRYVFTKVSDGTSQTVDATYSDNKWKTELTAATTSSWVDGEYRWELMVVRTSDSEPALLESNLVTVFGSTQDRRSHAEIMVGKIQSVLDGRADHDIESYSIRSRSITRMGVGELTKWRDYYLEEVSRTGGSAKKTKSPKQNTVRVGWAP